MVAKVVYLDDRRPKVTETMYCLFCNREFLLNHVTGTGQEYWPHDGCDETASVPLWSMRFGR